MTEKTEIYRCNICGNIVEVKHIGTGKLVCCDNPMELLKEKEDGVGPEKHLPIIEKTDNGVKVKIGSIPHPMEENHCIEWVEIIAEDKLYSKFLKPGEKPEAEFNIKLEDINKVQLREYCSVHGLWKS
jgi:superoxide reductase